LKRQNGIHVFMCSTSPGYHHRYSTQLSAANRAAGTRIGL